MLSRCLTHLMPDSLWQMRTRISDPLERLKRVMPREVLQSEVGWRARFDADQLVEKISLYAPVFYSMQSNSK